MPYSINFSDKANKEPLVVYDNTTSTDTSLKFPGRNSTGYGQVVGENFLHLLENFSSATEPTNPIEGQLWYDSGTGTLMIYDNVSWKAASSIRKSNTEPSVEADKVGELWVDTIKQQLYIWSGSTWVLVGPIFSTEDGLRTGPVVEIIDDSDNVSRSVVKFLVKEEPVAILSKDTFTPKITIPGFVTVKSGITMSATGVGDDLEVPKLYGTAQSADSLVISGTEVASSKFLRSDVVNTTEYGFNVKNNSGITIGVDGNFKLTSSVTSSKIYNANEGSSLDLQVNRGGTATTVLRILENKIGINVLSPQQELDIEGNIGLSGNLIVSNTDISTNLNNGSIRTQGGISVTKNIIVGTDLTVFGSTVVSNVLPSANDSYDLGSDPSVLGGKRWNSVYAKTINADTLNGTLEGDITGNSRTASALRETTTFRIRGDVISDDITFNGTSGSGPKTFNTTFTADIIAAKDEPFPNKSDNDDMILVYRSTAVSPTSNGLIKQSRDVFVGDLGVPIGAIMPFAGVNVPDGYLLCDGSEVEKAKYGSLYDIIGNTYGVGTLGINTFKLPDLRGRFALGKDNMDNNGTVPTLAGGFVDAGGNTAGRVTDINATTLGGSGGGTTNTLEVRNLPEHEHSLTPPGISKQFYAVRVDSTVVSGTSLTSTGAGPTAPGQAQYLSSSGGVKTSVTLGSPFAILNPYLTINYIIRSGPPAF